MNIILTNFSEKVDNMLMHGAIGAPIGTIAGLIVNNDTEASLIDSTVKGGIGGTIGAVSGGLISNEHLIGPSVGAVIGGSLAAKFAREKSFKDAFKDLYYKLERESNNSLDSNEFLFSDTGNTSLDMEAQKEESNLMVEKAEIQGKRKEAQIELNKLQEDQKKTSDNTFKEKEQINREQNLMDLQYDFGEPKDLDSYLRNNQQEISSNTRDFGNQQSKIEKLKDKIDQYREEEKNITESIDKKRNSSKGKTVFDRFNSSVSKDISEFKNIMTGQTKGTVI